MKTRKQRKTNKRLLELITRLEYLGRKEKSNIWKRVARELKKPRRVWRKVNLVRINKYGKENSDIIVPGKVLAFGDINKKFNVVAYDFTKNAIVKINLMGGKAILLKDYIEKNKKGKNTLLIG